MPHQKGIVDQRVDCSSAMLCHKWQTAYVATIRLLSSPIKKWKMSNMISLCSSLMEHIGLLERRPWACCASLTALNSVRLVIREGVPLLSMVPFRLDYDQWGTTWFRTCYAWIPYSCSQVFEEAHFLAVLFPMPQLKPLNVLSCSWRQLSLFSTQWRWDLTQAQLHQWNMTSIPFYHSFSNMSNLLINQPLALCHRSTLANMASLS